MSDLAKPFETEKISGPLANLNSAPTKAQVKMALGPLLSGTKSLGKFKFMEKDTIQMIEGTENYNRLLDVQDQSNKMIEKLDANLNNVLRKQEYEYLQAYNIYVKRKEKELKELIHALQEKNSNNSIKEMRINQMEVTIDQMRKQSYEDEKTQESLKKEIKAWKERQKVETEEKEFYHKQALDAKRKNKLLKVAIGRLQVQKQEVRGYGSDSPEKDSNTFLTGANITEQAKMHMSIDTFENSQALVEQNLINNTDFKRGQKPHKTRRMKAVKSEMTIMKSSEVSQYRNIPTENLKFQQFIDLMFESKMSKDNKKFEIMQYVQALETNYNDNLKEQKMRNDRLKKELRKEKSKHVNDIIQKGELENLFVDCVEDVRRNVIKRRLKAEIVGKKKIGKFDESSAEAQEFEESLLKLASLAKEHVKISDFTPQDKHNLLDLFVNNETTLLKIYEVLFPKKKQNTGFKTQSMQKLNPLKNSSESVHLSRNDFLKGDSIARSSADDTQAATDMMQNSTLLPSILPAANSIQSNDNLMHSITGLRSTQNAGTQSPNSNMVGASRYQNYQFQNSLENQHQNVSIS